MKTIVIIAGAVIGSDNNEGLFLTLQVTCWNKKKRNNNKATSKYRKWSTEIDKPHQASFINLTIAVEEIGIDNSIEYPLLLLQVKHLDR